MFTNDKNLQNHFLLSPSSTRSKSEVINKEMYINKELYCVDLSDTREFIKVHYLEQDFYLSINFTRDAIIGYTKNLTIFYWSKSAEMLLGYAEEEVIGTTMDKLVPECKHKELKDILNKFEQGGNITSFETIRQHKSGKIVDVEITITPLYHRNGEFHGVFMINRNISEKRRLINELQASEERWRRAIQGGKFGVWEWSMDSNVIMFYNNWYYDIGIQEVENKITFEDWLALVHRDDAANLQNSLNEAIKHGKEYVCEFRIQVKGGNYKWVREKGNITQYNDLGEPIKMIGTNEDINDRKLIEKQLAEKCMLLEQLKLEAEQANRAKTDFLSNVSHEIRTPMNGIVGILQLLRRTKLDKSQAKWLDMMKESVDILMVLINNLLDISKIEADKFELQNSLFNVKMLTMDIYNQLSVLCKPKRLDTKLYFDPMVKHMVIGDKIRIKQILLNLINNAVKFTDHGLVTLECRLIHSDEYTEKIEFKVEDTGVGIADYEIDKIFESFVQGDLSMKKKYLGTGLGLAISKKLALKMDGDIYVNSTYGQGSSFCFVCTLPKLKIPTNAIEMEDENQTIHEPVSQVTKTMEENEIRNEIILSVEDNPINQEIIEEMVRRCGFNMLSAYDGEEALKLMEKYQVNLVLMDLQMPVMNGYELTKRIRSIGCYQDIPIIATTAYAMEADRKRCLEAGMNDFIPKPIGLENLNNVLRKFLK